MKEYCSKDIPPQSVSEPETVYARLAPDHKAITEKPLKGRMTVDEFCNMLHSYVDEYYDGIQG